MSSWNDVRLDEVVELQRGHDLPLKARVEGDIPVLGSNGVVGFHNYPKYSGPGVTIGRSGVIGGATFTDGPYWPLNTCLFVKDFMGNDPRWVYYWLKSVDFTALDSGSAQPSLNRNYIASFPVSLPPVQEQRAIAEVLGAFDDKIAANNATAKTSEKLAGSVFDQMSMSLPTVPMSQKLTPILGGTPNRKKDDFWGGDELWASAGDITGAPHSVIADTEEKITLKAITQTKAKPLPAGGVVITARGTVGAVARLLSPSSFNQSCYGFSPNELPPSLLYFSVLRAAQRAKSISHGSVFDTITKQTFDHLLMPEFGDVGQRMEQQISPLLEFVDARVKENAILASLRDTLLPQLMSGKLRARDAEAVVEDVL